jgi:hypothetical protein
MQAAKSELGIIAHTVGGIAGRFPCETKVEYLGKRVVEPRFRPDNCCSVSSARHASSGFFSRELVNMTTRG